MRTALGLSLVVCVAGVACSAADKNPSNVTPRNVAGSTANNGSAGSGNVGNNTGGTPSVAMGGPVLTGVDGGRSSGGNGGQVDPGMCATLSVQTVELVATVSLLVDTSGSMFQQPAPFWTPLHDALMDPTNGVVKQLQASTRFGFTSYTGLGDSYENATTFKCPILQSVPYALNNYAAIDKMYSGIKYNSEAWETPTHAPSTPPRRIW